MSSVQTLKIARDCSEPCPPSPPPHSNTLPLRLARMEGVLEGGNVVEARVQVWAEILLGHLNIIVVTPVLLDQRRGYLVKYARDAVDPALRVVPRGLVVGPELAAAVDAARRTGHDLDEVVHLGVGIRGLGHVAPSLERRRDLLDVAEAVGAREEQSRLRGAQARDLRGVIIVHSGGPNVEGRDVEVVVAAAFVRNWLSFGQRDAQPSRRRSVDVLEVSAAPRRRRSRRRGGSNVGGRRCGRFGACCEGLEAARNDLEDLARGEREVHVGHLPLVRREIAPRGLELLVGARRHRDVLGGRRCCRVVLGPHFEQRASGGHARAHRAQVRHGVRGVLLEEAHHAGTLRGEHGERAGVGACWPTDAHVEPGRDVAQRIARQRDRRLWDGGDTRLVLSMLAVFGVLSSVSSSSSYGIEQSVPELFGRFVESEVAHVLAHGRDARDARSLRVGSRGEQLARGDERRGRRDPRCLGERGERGVRERHDDLVGGLAELSERGRRVSREKHRFGRRHAARTREAVRQRHRRARLVRAARGPHHALGADDRRLGRGAVVVVVERERDAVLASTRRALVVVVRRGVL
mmetsp:Transcript_14109/g.56237  ORF Transcript_14109/g.56237 Transcript_14109/m.56237 type:complete len:577 (+) Transcript_14109:771-2501(+)